MFTREGGGQWPPYVFLEMSFMVHSYLPTIPDSPELLRKSASNYGITARGKIITEIVDYGNLVTSGNNW